MVPSSPNCDCTRQSSAFFGGAFSVARLEPVTVALSWHSTEPLSPDSAITSPKRVFPLAETTRPFSTEMVGIAASTPTRWAAVRTESHVKHPTHGAAASEGGGWPGAPGAPPVEHATPEPEPARESMDTN